MLSENGINSSHQKDNFLITTNHSIVDNLNNNNLNNLNSYAKSTTITTSSSSPSLSSSSIQSTSMPDRQQLRIYIPNYDDFIDTIRSQQPHSSRASGSGMSSDNRRSMNDRRLNPMMDRQSVSSSLSHFIFDSNRLTRYSEESKKSGKCDDTNDVLSCLFALLFLHNFRVITIHLQRNIETMT